MDKITISVGRDDESRGQVGIGTLIVFIAMVLVAAIAAGVLINTAGFLQTKSEQTGQQSADQVTNNVDIISKVGVVNNTKAINSVDINTTGGTSADTPISALRGEFVTVSTNDSSDIVFNNSADATNTFTISSGDKVKVVVNDTDATLFQSSGTTIPVGNAQIESPRDAVVTFTSSDGPSVEVRTADGETLNATGTTTPTDAVEQIKLTVKRNSGSDDIDLSSTTINYIGPNGVTDLKYSGDGAQQGSYFGVATVKDDDGSAPVLSSTDDRFTILVNPDALLENDELEMRITTDSGATKTVRVQVPQSLVDESAVQL
ncbi:MAG: archaellin/type IV pilin N-terminal domain-containing protein [Halarchaeum sp.]